MRHKNVISPYQERARGRAPQRDNVVDATLVVNPDDLAAFDAMPRPKQPPRKREPEVSHAAARSARKDRNGVA